MCAGVCVSVYVCVCVSVYVCVCVHVCVAYNVILYIQRHQYIP